MEKAEDRLSAAEKKKAPVSGENTRCQRQFYAVTRSIKEIAARVHDLDQAWDYRCPR